MTWCGLPEPSTLGVSMDTRLKERCCVRKLCRLKAVLSMTTRLEPDLRWKCWVGGGEERKAHSQLRWCGAPVYCTWPGSIVVHCVQLEKRWALRGSALAGLPRGEVWCGHVGGGAHTLSRCLSEPFFACFALDSPG